jgi:hypothetical protein
VPLQAIVGGRREEHNSPPRVWACSATTDLLRADLPPVPSRVYSACSVSVIFDERERASHVTDPQATVPFSFNGQVGSVVAVVPGSIHEEASPFPAVIVSYKFTQVNR